jgi:hypothetical protein
MFAIMKWYRLNLIGLTAGVLVTASIGSASADVTPYDVIVDRNPFGLKPPPPPPDPSETAAKAPPPAPPATVELTGITSILSSKRALLEIVPGPGKPMIKPILGEGERVESVEVVSINVEKNEVTIKNGQLVTNLTFKIAKAGGPPPPQPGGVVPPALPGATPAGAQTTYNNFNQSQTSGGRGVMVGGGSPAAPASANPAYGGVNPGLVNPGVGVNPGLGTTPGTEGGFRSIPSRNIRTPQPQAGAPIIDPQQQMEEIEQNRARNYLNSQTTGRALPPLPPTYLTPDDAPDGTGRRPPVLPPLPGQTR